MSIDVNVQNDLVIVTESSEDITVNVSNAAGPAGPAGAAGVGVPTGGSTGQILKKLSNTNYDTYWALDGGGVPYSGATGDVDLGEYELKAGQVEFDQTPTGTAGVGVMRWNDSDGTVDLGLKGGNVTLQVGQEQILRVVNKTGSDLLESQYSAVRIRLAAEGGSQGQRLAVVLAQGNNDANSSDTIGIVTETITNNQEGFICTSGIVRGINTTGSLQGETWADGDIIYLSPTTAGAITKVKPTAPNHSVILGYVIYAHAVNGKIFVKCDNGYEIGELHDVYAPSPSNNDGIFWNTANLRYQNNSIAGVLGYTPVPTTRTLTINGTAYDLSADRSWTVSSAANTIYTADGTLSADRTITSDGKSLTILGGKEEVSGFPSEQISLRLQGSTTAKNPYLSLKNTNATGKDYALRSLTDGTFEILNYTNLSLVLKHEWSSNLFTLRASSTITNTDFYLGNNTVVGLWLNGTRTIENYSICHSAGNTFLNAPTGGKIGFRAGNADKMTLTNAGRLLLGTTTESTYLLDVNGTARVSGAMTAGSTSNVAIYIPNNTAIRSNNSAGNLYIDASDPVGSGTIFLRANLVNSSEIITPNATITGIAKIGTAIKGNTATNGSLYFDTSLDLNTGTAYFRGGNWAFESIAGNPTTFASAILNINSTTKGFLPPRMTNAQRSAISSPAVGLIVYCTDATEGLYEYTSSGWINLNGEETNRQTASYTLALTDNGKLVEMNVASANNLTVPLNSSIAFPIGTKIDIAQYGAGQTTVVATGGVTIRSAGGALKLAAQYSGGSLVKIATDEWYLFGDITV